MSQEPVTCVCWPLETINFCSFGLDGQRLSRRALSKQQQPRPRSPGRLMDLSESLSKRIRRDYWSRRRLLSEDPSFLFVAPT